METKEDQTVARRAATLTDLKDGGDSPTPAPVQKGEGVRRKDEITLRVPNPLFSGQEAPQATEDPALDSASTHSAPTAKLKVSSLVWNEYNSMPLTPAPVAAGQAQGLARSSGSEARPKNRRGLMFVLVILIISAGVIAGVLIPREKTTSPVGPPSESEAKGPVLGSSEESLEAPKSPAVPVATPPTPSTPARRHVSVRVEPAEATLTLDGVAAGGPTIARDLVQDKAIHVVQASAPGHLPFKKSFTLQQDVSLRINLRKAAVPVGHPKTRAAEPIVRPTASETKNAIPRDEAVEEFGMDLNRPAVTRQTKKMDEKDPYAP